MPASTQRDPDSLIRRLSKQAAADMRMLLPGDPDGPALRALAELGGMPAAATMVRWRSGEMPSPLAYLVAAMVHLYEAGCTEAHLMIPEMSLRNYRAIITGRRATAPDLHQRFREVAHRSFVSDHEEEPVERDLFENGFSVPHIRRYLPVLAREVADKQEQLKVGTQLLTQEGTTT